MESFLFYVNFFAYLGKTIFKKSKLEKLKKYGTKEEVQDYIKKIVKDWTKYILEKVHAKIEVSGRENIPSGNCLYVSNHQGNFDIPIFLEILDDPVGFIAKKEILRFKTFSYWMRQINCIFMDRANIRESMKSINEGVQMLKDGHSMVIFPEGTRSKSEEVHEFKKGSMKLALKSGVPIVPVTINGSYKLLEKNNEYNKDNRIVKVIIHKPIYPKELSKEQQVNLAENMRKTILDSIISDE